MRRIVKGLLVALVVVLALGGGLVWWRTGVLDVTAIKPGLRMLAGVGSNVTVIATGEGTIVVDSMTLVGHAYEEAATRPAGATAS